MARKKAAKKAPSASTRLANIEKLVRQGFRQVDRRFERVDQRFERVDQRFEQVDQRFAGIDQRLDGIDQRLDGIDQRLDRGEQRMDILGFGQRELKSDFDAKFAILDERINVLTNHVDGFMKLHETLDIEFKVIKEQMSRLEARLNRLEAGRTT